MYVETHTRKQKPRAWEGRLVGYSMGSNSFCTYNPEEQNMRESRNVIFIATTSVMPKPV